MEQIPATAAAATPAPPPAPAPAQTNLQLGKDVKVLQRGGPAKKKRGPMQLFRVALFMLRGHSGGKYKKPIPVDVAEKAGALTKLVGSMRPLHLQDKPYPPGQVPSLAVVPASPAATAVEQYEDVLPLPVSPLAPFTPSSPCSSDGGASSRYASAQNLQELDDDADEDGGDGGDCMIDAKAEKFIAQFYAQMKLQRLGCSERHNRMIAGRKQ